MIYAWIFESIWIFYVGGSLARRTWYFQLENFPISSRYPTSSDSVSQSLTNSQHNKRMSRLKLNILFKLVVLQKQRKRRSKKKRVENWNFFVCKVCGAHPAQIFWNNFIIIPGWGENVSSSGERDRCVKQEIVSRT